MEKDLYKYTPITLLISYRINTYIYIYILNIK